MNGKTNWGAGAAAPDVPVERLGAAAYVHPVGDGMAEAHLMIEGIHCAGCVNTIEKGLLQRGAADVRVNLGNHRATLRWDETRQSLGGLLAELKGLGYEAHPYDPKGQEQTGRQLWRRMLLRLGVAGFGAGNVMLLSVGLYAGRAHGMAGEYRLLLQGASALLALPVLLFGGWPFLAGAWAALRRARFSMDSLIALGILTTFSASTLALLRGEGETYYDSVVMIVFFLLLGRALETLARNRGGSVTEGLLGLQGQWATVLEDGKPRQVPLAAVRPGWRLLVRPGDAIPTDGRISEGVSELDESAMTGESAPRPVKPGERVLGGTVNLAAPLVMLAEQVGEQTVLARICAMVEQAQAAKAPIQGLADRVAAHFVSVILLLSGLTFAVWQWLLPGTAPQAPWLIATSVLIIACPCALGLATPVAVLAGGFLAGAKGVLIKGGEVLEQAARVSDVVLDKTGTLTQGHLQVKQVWDWQNQSRRDWLGAAAAVEAQSAHPLAQAVLRQWEREFPATPLPAALEAAGLPGLGVQGTVHGQEVLVGSGRLMAERGIDLPGGCGEEAAGTLCHVAIAGKAVGMLALEDPLRDDAVQTVCALKALGLQLHLLSGDRPEVVAQVAEAVSIAQAQGALLPGDKLARIVALQQQGKIVAMVGDGLNDTPALSQADVGIAVSTGSDLALETAGIILLKARLLGLADAITLSRRTLGIIKQNLALSLGYNLLAVPLAMVGWVMPLFAALAMASSSLLVVGNALRFRIGGGK